MNRYAAHAIRAAAALLLALQAAIACAQAPAEPLRSPGAAGPPALPDRPVPRVPMEQGARESAAKADALQKAMDARIRRVTQSICVGCSDRANRPHRRVPRPIEEPRDPAQAPED